MFYVIAYLICVLIKLFDNGLTKQLWSQASCNSM